jgi:membrane protein YdbS with pleckstrin-like domain
VVKGLITRWLRVPPEPEAPAGEHLQVFRAAPSYYHYALLRWALKQLIAAAGTVAFIASIGDMWTDGIDGAAEWSMFIGELWAVAAVVAQAAFTGLMVRLDYELRWYMLTDRSLRIREGVWSVREMTMSLANIQNIAVSRGPLQRLLGIADVKVQSAGGGIGASRSDGSGQSGVISMHEGVFRGVADAPAIRDLLARRLEVFRDAGLGDGDEVMQPRTSTPDNDAGDLRAAMMALSAEASALHRAALGAAEAAGPARRG